MKSEADPITDDEWLLRRIHKDRFKSNRAPFVSPSAFEPRMRGRDPDVDGISLFREACLSSPEEILGATPAEKRNDQGIVRVSVSAIRNELHLSVVLKPDPLIPGHVVIPEISTNTFSEKKQELKQKLLRLAEMASGDENIVRWPPSAQPE